MREPITRIQKLEVILSILVNYYWVRYHHQIQKLRVRAITYFADKSEYNMLQVVCRLGSLTRAVLASHKIAPSFPGELLLATCPTPYRLLHEAPLSFPTTWLDSKGKKSQENQVKNVMPFITCKSLSSHRSTHILVEE